MSKKKIKVFKEYDEAHIFSVINRVGSYKVLKAPNTPKSWVVELKNRKLLTE
jgi:hypothetical protein